MGACALAPIVVVDDQPHGQMTTDAAVKLVNDAKVRRPETASVSPPSTAVAPRGGVDLSAVPPR